jgi:hypothetical protein
MATPQEISLCERVCRKASAMGYRLKIAPALGGMFFESDWLHPSGQPLGSGIDYSREVALVNACTRLAPALGL